MRALRSRFRDDVAIAAFAFVMVLAPRAHADDTIARPGDHPVYRAEIEPHLAVGWDNLYGESGVGAGARLSIPIVRNGFIDTINDNVAISFGADAIHYEGCYYASRCAASYLFVPVAMQWNFFVARQWSVFAEPGAFLYKGFYDACLGAPGCVEPPLFGLRPAFAVGGRYHVNENVAFVMRVGYPSISFGVSFM